MNNKHLSWIKEINNNFIIASRAYFLQCLVKHLSKHSTWFHCLIQHDCWTLQVTLNSNPTWICAIIFAKPIEVCHLRTSQLSSTILVLTVAISVYLSDADEFFTYSTFTMVWYSIQQSMLDNRRVTNHRGTSLTLLGRLALVVTISVDLAMPICSLTSPTLTKTW